MASLPPGTRFAAAESIKGLIASSSPLTSILIAWKVRFAGWGPSALAALGIASLMISASSCVVVIGFFARVLHIAAAILGANRSSP